MPYGTISITEWDFFNDCYKVNPIGYWVKSLFELIIQHQQGLVMSRFCDTTTEMGVHSRHLCKFWLDHGQNTKMIGIILNHVCSFHKLEHKMLIEIKKNWVWKLFVFHIIQEYCTFFIVNH